MSALRSGVFRHDPFLGFSRQGHPFLRYSLLLFGPSLTVSSAGAFQPRLRATEVGFLQLQVSTVASSGVPFARGSTARARAASRSICRTSASAEPNFFSPRRRRTNSTRSPRRRGPRSTSKRCTSRSARAAAECGPHTQRRDAVRHWRAGSSGSRPAPRDADGVDAVRRQRHRVGESSGWPWDTRARVRAVAHARPCRHRVGAAEQAPARPTADPRRSGRAAACSTGSRRRLESLAPRPRSKSSCAPAARDRGHHARRGPDRKPTRPVITSATSVAAAAQTARGTPLASGRRTRRSNGWTTIVVDAERREPRELLLREAEQCAARCRAGPAAGCGSKVSTTDLRVASARGARSASLMARWWPRWTPSNMPIVSAKRSRGQLVDAAQTFTLDLTRRRRRPSPADQAASSASGDRHEPAASSTTRTMPSSCASRPRAQLLPAREAGQSSAPLERHTGKARGPVSIGQQQLRSAPVGQRRAHLVERPAWSSVNGPLAVRVSAPR